MVKKNFAPLSTNTACHPKLVSGSQRKKSSAFTLIELLVVIVIVGILATVSVAQFNDYQERARFAKAQAFASQADTVLMAETVSTGYGFPLRLDFDEGSGTVAKDSSGSGNDVTSFSNLAWSTDTPDNSSHSIQIANGTQYVYNVKNMPESEISYSVFFKINTIPDALTVPVHIGFNSGIKVFPDGTINMNINGYPGSITVSSSAGTIKEGRWYHVLATYKNGQARLFLDGDLVDQQDVGLTLPFNVNGNTSTTDLTFKIGYHNFDGAIDRVRIYPVGLDPDNL